MLLPVHPAVHIASGFAFFSAKANGSKSAAGNAGDLAKRWFMGAISLFGEIARECHV
jgi:hypothetical protein